MKSKDFWVVAFLTVIVSFCSIVYELIYSQALTVLYGGTVARYSTTIGLYLISLGFGAFFFNALKFRSNLVFFWRTELALSIAGPGGLVAIFALNAAALARGWPAAPVFFLSHAPIVLVGVLSGIELPLLVSLLDGGARDRFSKILGVDYVGSFLGTVVYSLVLYPEYGLISTSFAVGFMNFLVTVIYVLWKLRREVLRNALGFILLILYFLVLLSSGRIQSDVEKLYRENEIRRQLSTPGVANHPGGGKPDVRVIEAFSTPYQDVTLYETIGPDGLRDTCLNLDSHTQLCDSTQEFYHSGLVDVPMLFLGNRKDVRVLILGGGDWIALDHVLKYPNVASADLVDIDRKFFERMKEHPHFQALHHRAFENPKARVITDDAFKFLRYNKEKYDFVVIDLPGISHDKLAHLYSVEFFYFLARSLADDGIVSTWTYGAAGDLRKHYMVLMNTLREAGFRFVIPYDALRAGDGNFALEQPFNVFSKSEDLRPALGSFVTHYIEKTWSFYQGLEWSEIPMFSGIRANTILRPNYGVIVKVLADHEKIDKIETDMKGYKGI